MARSKSSGRAYDNWLRKSSKALAMDDRTASPSHGFGAISAPGAVLGRRSAGADADSPARSLEHGPSQLSSYHKRLAEIRAREHADA
jgi:hypothetical protein